MSTDQPNNPLHGITLKTIMEDLVSRYSWQELHDKIAINCFINNPSIKSSLKFLRKTEWARDKVEALYVRDHIRIERNKKRNKRRAEMRKFRKENTDDESS
ncbi:MAG: transporter [Deltaproteobacteria bacterium]|nr:transporter [Deltaproteobacteria bacterium]